MNNPYNKIIQECLKYKGKQLSKIEKKGTMLPLPDINEKYKSIMINLEDKGERIEYFKQFLTDNKDKTILLIDCGKDISKCLYSSYASDNIIIKCSDGYIGKVQSLNFDYILVDNSKLLNKTKFYDWLNKIKANINNFIIMLG